MNKIWILVDFKVHQDYIEKVLCINKEEPEKACHGKCYLTKKLKKQEKEEQKQVPSNANEKNEVLFAFSNRINAFESASIFVGKRKSKYSNFYNFKFVGQIFHPPQTV